jgi:hypothetical protein
VGIKVAFVRRIASLHSCTHPNRPALHRIACNDCNDATTKILPGARIAMKWQHHPFSPALDASSFPLRPLFGGGSASLRSRISLEFGQSGQEISRVLGSLDKSAIIPTHHPLFPLPFSPCHPTCVVPIKAECVSIPLLPFPECHGYRHLAFFQAQE